MGPTANTAAADPPRPATESAQLTEFKTGEPTAPADKWETTMIWAFILRFLPLKGTVEGLENVGE